MWNDWIVGERTKAETMNVFERTLIDIMNLGKIETMTVSKSRNDYRMEPAWKRRIFKKIRKTKSITILEGLKD